MPTRLPTHTGDRVTEHHDGKTYMTRKRSIIETQRLQSLAQLLDPTQEWTIERKMMSGPVIRISVDAAFVREAKAIADEVVYAQNWLRGMFRKDHGKKAPEDWALKYTDFEMVRG